MQSGMPAAAGLTLPIVITDCLIASDGGSIRFSLKDAKHKMHFLEIPQNVLKENFVQGIPPGVLILDGGALDPGKSEERAVLSALQNADIVPLTEKREITVHNEAIIIPQTEEMREETREFIARMVERIISSFAATKTGRPEDARRTSPGGSPSGTERG